MTSPPPILDQLHFIITRPFDNSRPVATRWIFMTTEVPPAVRPMVHCSFAPRTVLVRSARGSRLRRVIPRGHGLADPRGSQSLTPRLEAEPSTNGFQFSSVELSVQYRGSTMAISCHR